ncbi:unnamed protein product [Gongylonema pulchrum]|uniref:GCR1_C domain-containing protein n=1 Tax=Gongylonema pulchrum TaxID=637853 RepID=A0A183DDL7_9BILA|nr:unnamed protein product [Gongylonema pulchrum]
MSSSYTTIGTDTPSTSAACSTSSLLSEARSGVDWMRKLAAKYQHIRGTYNSYRNNCTVEKMSRLVLNEQLGAKRHAVQFFNYGVNRLLDEF